MRKVTDKSIRAVFASGGSGGHLAPGMVVAEALRERCPRAEVLFVTSGRDVERHMLSIGKADWEEVPTHPWRGWPRAAQWLLNTSRALSQSARVLSQFHPDVVVGLGGHGSVPVGLTAARRRIPMLLMEQNTIPGKANRLLARWAQTIACHWHMTRRYLATPRRCVVTGNPVRRPKTDVPGNSPTVAHDEPVPFGLSRQKPTLLILGGSQGARPINQSVVQALPRFARELPDVQIIHSTGALDYESVRSHYEKSDVAAAVSPFIDDMASAYAMADLCVCRAGATTLAELAAHGVPSVLVPYPFAADNHQFWNARVFSDRGASTLLLQPDLSADRLILEVGWTLGDHGRLVRMSNAARGLDRPDAADRVVSEILALAA